MYTSNTNEIMDYVNRHPETADFILTLEKKIEHKLGDILYKSKDTTSGVQLTANKSIKLVLPVISKTFFNGEPVYLIRSNGVLIYIPIGWIMPISVEHREYDDSAYQEVVLQFFYFDAIHTLEIHFA